MCSKVELFRHSRIYIYKVKAKVWLRLCFVVRRHEVDLCIVLERSLLTMVLRQRAWCKNADIWCTSQPRVEKRTRSANSRDIIFTAAQMRRLPREVVSAERWRMNNHLGSCVFCFRQCQLRKLGSCRLWCVFELAAFIKSLSYGLSMQVSNSVFL